MLHSDQRFSTSDMSIRRNRRQCLDVQINDCYEQEMGMWLWPYSSDFWHVWLHLNDLLEMLMISAHEGH